MFLLKFIIPLVILKISHALDASSSVIAITNESCSDNPCKNGASCVPLIENGFYCKCTEGFAGKKCEIKNRKLKSLEIKRCDESNCFSGKCGKKDGKAACLCIPGFTGDMCDTKIDPCSNNPCQNNGLCISELNDKFSCLCLPGFIGILVQKKIHVQKIHAKIMENAEQYKRVKTFYTLAFVKMVSMELIARMKIHVPKIHAKIMDCVNLIWKAK